MHSYFFLEAETQGGRCDLKLPAFRAIPRSPVVTKAGCGAHHAAVVPPTATMAYEPRPTTGAGEAVLAGTRSKA